MPLVLTFKLAARGIINKYPLPFSLKKKKGGYKSNSITRELKLTGPWSKGQADKGNFKKDISLVHII